MEIQYDNECICGQKVNNHKEYCSIDDSTSSKMELTEPMEVPTIAKKTTLEPVSTTDTLEVPSGDCKPSSKELTSDCKPSEDWSERFDHQYEGSHIDFSYKGDRDNVKSFIRQTRQEAVEEYKQFILNIIDDIDKAEKENGFTPTSTRLIRLEIESRIIN